MRQYRQAAALSQEALAERAGLSPDAISVIERGKRGAPRPETVALLAEALGLSGEQRAAFIAAARAVGAAPVDSPSGPPHATPLPEPEALPSGTMTFLFTDVEGSTRLWEQYPQAMGQALARHDALVAEHVERHGGVLVRPRGEGDSRFAIFARATDAVAAAAALQQALQTEAWPLPTPLRVRLALHTGEAQLREGDYYGNAVNRCARLRAVAHGGQVLLSAATYELVRDVLPPDVTLRDLGAHRLKDLTRAEHIFQVLHADLPGDFPPLTTLDRQRHNLPVQPTALIGREREVADVRERLLERKTRLLTLTGAGGVGKTRLALQVAAETLDAFPAGVFFVNLAPIADPDLVLPTIAQALGVREAGGQPLRETLHAFLQEKQLLLVLDNFEQVLEAALVVADLLAACAQVRLLVTSRAALQLRGERLYTVPPLTLPALTPPLPLETLTQYEAVRLFLARAQDVQPDFAVTNATAPAIAEICVRLDGLPLAIELVTARIRVLPPQALLSRLSSRLTVVAGGGRDLPARQQTLRATINWSYHLLTADEQRLFARLAVFVGGCTLEAVEAVCNVDGTLDVLAGVESLVAKSLLRQEEGAAAEPRFRMLETIHEYARERLAASGEAEEVRRRHAEYFVALAEAAEPELRGPQQGEWLQRLEAEHDNLRAALTWSREQAEPELELRLAGALWQFWERRGHFSEGRRWLDAVLGGSGEAPAPARAKALDGAGVLAFRQGDYERATALHEEALGLRRELGDKVGIALSLNNLGDVAWYQGDYGRATALQEESLALRRELGDKWGMAASLNRLGSAAWEQGDYGRATALHEESMALHRELGNKRGIAAALNNLGNVAHQQGDYGRATALFEEALALFRELGDRWSIAMSVSNLGDVAHHQGDYRRAAALYAESLTLCRTIGYKWVAAYCLEGLAGVAGAQGQPQRAARIFGAAEATRSLIGAPLEPNERPRYERLLAAVRAQLDEETFAAAWTAGQALPLEQAIAEALREEAAPA